MTLEGECSKVKGSWSCCVAMSVKMVCSLGYLSAENINLCVCACQNILLSVCVLAVLSSLQDEDNSVSCIIFLLSSSSAHAHKHTQALHIPLSPFPISEHTQAYVAFIRADLQYFYWMTQWHQQTDCSATIYQISPGIWHLWVLFFSSLPHFAWNTFGFQRPRVIPDACQKKFEVLSELLPDF